MARKQKHHTPSRSALPRRGSSTSSAKGAVCPYCGKRSYFTRKYAKEAAKVLYPHTHLTPYTCVKAPEFVDTSQLWHLGHLGEQVVNMGVDRALVHRTKPRDTVKNSQEEEDKDA